MESGLYIPKSGSITPRSIQGNALKPPADIPEKSGEIPSLQCDSSHLSKVSCTWMHCPHISHSTNHRVSARAPGMLLLLASSLLKSIHLNGTHQASIDLELPLYEVMQ